MLPPMVEHSLALKTTKLAVQPAKAETLARLAAACLVICLVNQKLLNKTSENRRCSAANLIPRCLVDV